jgi:curved DNA-binding protein CbpA
MVKDTTLYDRLEVLPSADENEIKKAYNRLSKKWHPDKNIDNQEEANQKFQEITLAKEVLLDSEKRDLYNKIGKCASQKTIILPMQLNYDTGHFLNCGLGLDIFGFPINEGIQTNFFYADGAAIFMKKADFFELGMFDDTMFLIQEDVDLSWKARLMGFSLLKAENIIIFHKSGHSIDDQTDKSKSKSKSFSSSRFRRYYGERNSLRNLLKNYSILNLIWILPITTTIAILEILMFTLIGNPKAGMAYIKAYYWNIINIGDTLKKRKWIQNRRTVGDVVILGSMYKGSAKLKLLLEVGIPRVKI